jgi:hypothetical chaperone protein
MAQAPTLGIDFGTSNTAAAVLVDGRSHVIELEPGEKTLPTAIFLDYSARRTLYGNTASRALIDGREGRYMRALKSVLGTPLVRERRQFLNEKLTLIEVIARFLAEIRTRAETACHMPVTSVLSGRPVHFHRDPARNAQAAVDLEGAYRLAGFGQVRFMPEPEAAALSSGAAGGDGLGLIVDIGGGTSDFSLFRSRSGAVEVIASHGIRLGGTDFDRLVSLAKVMPLFGMGGDLRDDFGPGTHAAPHAVFHDLARWETIPFLYTPETRRLARDMARVAVEPRKFGRLETVLENELGHDVAFAVERGKIAANRADPGQGVIGLGVVESGLAARVTTAELAAILTGEARDLEEAALATLAMAAIRPETVETIVYVGGSSLMQVVETTLRDLFPGARHLYSNVFTAVVDGLALGTARGLP